MIENEQTTSTVEINLTSGWKVTHYSKTWDLRERLDTLEVTFNEKVAQLERLQAEVDELKDQKAQVDTLPDKTKTILFAPTVVTDSKNATSTPMM